MLNKIYVENKPEWVCWQTGLELRYLEAPLFSMKQVLPKVASLFDYHGMKMMLNQEDNWSDIDTATSSILELSLPQDTVVIKRPIFDQDDENSVGYYQAIVLDPNPKAVIFDSFFPIFSIQLVFFRNLKYWTCKVFRFFLELCFLLLLKYWKYSK